MFRAILSLGMFPAWVSAQDSWIDKFVPLIHGPSDYPSASRAWDKLAPAWLTIQKNHAINSNSLPLLPCISFPNITMSDGTKIYTVVVNPWPCNKKKGAVVVRSPYGPTSQNMALIYLVLNGHAAVMQDQRGTFLSGGKFDMFRQDVQDGLETMEWITSQSWSNGDIYTAGVSADGIPTMTPAIIPNAPVKGQWSMYTTSQGHEFIYPQGAYRHDLNHGYLKLIALLSEGRTPAEMVESSILRNEQFGPWWYNLTLSGGPANLSSPDSPPGNRFKNIHWPVLFSVGWWDIFQGSELRDFEGLYTKSLGDPAWREKHVLIVDPLGHCAIGNTEGFGHQGGKLYEAAVNGVVVAGELASEFFAGNTDGPLRSKIGRVNLYIMGNFEGDTPGIGSYWTSLQDWPASKLRNFYMQPGRVLSDSFAATSTSVSYTYDPSAKDGNTPMLGGDNLPFVGQIKHCGSTDQLPRESRDDVIIFDSGVLTEDLPVVGRIQAKLFVSSSAKDTDFVVTLSDLGKKSMLVRYGAVRMRWREGYHKAAPLTNGTVYEVDIDLWHTAYVFPKGHRVRVAISSAAYPYYDANPNTNDPESKSIAPSKFKPVPATNALHVGPEYPSMISLPVVAVQDIPHNPSFHPSIPPLAEGAPPGQLIV